jgi:vitamin B12 transporter
MIKEIAYHPLILPTLLLALLIFESAHSTCTAQEQKIHATNRTDSIHLISEATVTAMRISKEIIPAQQLAGKELQSLNQLSVADALRYFAGVQLKDYGGIGGIKTINIRSMGTNHVGVFYDGVQLSNAQNGQVDLGMYSLDNLQSVSLFNGQKSEIFQSAKDFASAGSIYLWTRTPEFRTGQNYHLKANVRSGSFDLVNPSLLIDLKLSDYIKASFNAEWISSSGKYHFRYRRRAAKTGEIMYDTTATRQNGDIRATRMEGSLFGNLRNGSWMAKIYNYTSERGVPGAIVNNVWRRGERIWDNNSFIQTSFQKAVSKKFKTQLLTKYAYYLTKYVNKDTTVMRIDNVYKQKEFYLSTANLYCVNNMWDISMAYDFQWNKMDADMYAFVYPTRYTHLCSLATALNLGCLKIQGSIVANYIHDRVKLSESPGDKKSFTPAVFAAYKPFKIIDFTLRAFAKRSFRMPTFNDLYYAEMGNSRLKPERATQFDIGFKYDSPVHHGFWKEWGLQVDVYHNRVSNKIIAYPKGAQFRWTMLNLGKVDIKGIDAVAHTTIAPIKDLYITGKLQYTYQKAIDITNPADTYYQDQIPYIPWNSGSAIMQMSYRSWLFNYSFIYTGERYNQQENIIYNHTQPWYTSDISLIKTFHLFKCSMKATCEINNLFSQDYDVILNYPMPKRNYRFSLCIDL